MTINIINSLIVAPLTAAIGIFPYYHRPNQVTKYFAQANIALAIWNLGESSTLLFNSHAMKLLIYKVDYIAGVLLVLFFFRFCFAFSKIDVKSIPILWKSIITISVFLLICLPSRLFIADFNESLIQEIPGPVYPVFVVYMLGSLFYALLRMGRAYLKTTGNEAVRYWYLFVALMIAFLEAVLFFLSTNVFHIPSYYYYLQIVYVCIIGYAIAAHQLMNIKVVVRKTLVYSIVTGALTAVYLLIATQLAKVLEGAGGKAGFVSSAIAAAAVTLLFNPLLNRVRAFMDQKIFGDWLRDMSRGVVHEVKRPLASISMPAQLVLMELADVENGKITFEDYLPTLKERLNGIVKKTIEANDRIEALYTLSDSERREGKTVNVKPLLETSLGFLKSGLAEFGISLTLDVSQSLSPILGDAKQLEIVFVNLIKNAVESISISPPTRRALAVAAWEEGRFICVSIKDSGRGISLDDQAHLFDAHFTTKGSNGMGLGLYLTDKIVREHGGRIQVESREGQGTEFTVYLPKQASERKDAVNAA